MNSVWNKFTLKHKKMFYNGMRFMHPDKAHYKSSTNFNLHLNVCYIDCKVPNTRKGINCWYMLFHVRKKEGKNEVDSGERWGDVGENNKKISGKLLIRLGPTQNVYGCF
jgi:hypothetical protein